MKITAGIYLYSAIKDKILLCHATKSKNIWSIPKGVIDEGETAFEAALRETLEETNIDIRKINIIEMQALPVIQYKKQKKILESFLIITDTNLDDIELKCTTLVKDHYPEIDQYRWVNFEEFGFMAHEAQLRNLPLIMDSLSKRQINQIKFQARRGNLFGLNFSKNERLPGWGSLS